MAPGLLKPAETGMAFAPRPATGPSPVRRIIKEARVVVEMEPQGLDADAFAEAGRLRGIDDLSHPLLSFRKKDRSGAPLHPLLFRALVRSFPYCRS